MAENEILSPIAQAAIVGLLCFSNTHGLELAGIVQPEHFDRVHKDLATAILNYRRKYKGKAPGAKQLPMLLEYLPIQEEQYKAIKLLAASLPKVLKGVNRDYIVSQASTFVRAGGIIKHLMVANDFAARKP